MNDAVKDMVMDLIKIGLEVNIESEVLDVIDYGNTDEITILMKDGKQINLTVTKDLGGE